jgi:acetyl-CoA carboxylase biotin carboxyl carrier protein
VAAPAPVAPLAVSAAAPAAPQADDKRFLQITSPMVGTFYAAGSPDAKPFSSVGTAISEDSVVCLIEAMKVFNEIKAGVSGKIAKICVKNEDPVEFGQVLFLVDPS